MDETRLDGGRTTDVARVGDTVRRGTGHWTKAVHALLTHLEDVGFDGSPRVLGIDDCGREMLAFVDGQVGTLSPENPLPQWFRTEQACAEIGSWIRRFQDAQRGFEPLPSAPWRRAAPSPLTDGQVIVHHDVSPYNTVRTPSGRLVVLDWDFARPGSPLEDVAWAAWRWAPIMSGTWWHREFGAGNLTAQGVFTRQRTNLAALLDGYGASAADREQLVGLIGRTMLDHADDLEDMARTDPAFSALVDDGYVTAARNDAAWWEQHHAQLMTQLPGT